MLPNWLYGKSKSKLAELLGGGGTPSDYNQVKAQVTQNTEDIASLNNTLDTKAAITQITNPNLLDNPWFTVNQRGDTSWSSYTGYKLDRWFLDEGSGSINDGVLTHSNSYYQKWEDDRVNTILGKTVTMSWMFSDGTIGSETTTLPSSLTSSYVWPLNNSYVAIALISNGSQMARVTAGTSLKAIKLELGSISTLAMDTAPDYATELLKCQRYFITLKTPVDLSAYTSYSNLYTAPSDGYVHFVSAASGSAARTIYTYGNNTTSATDPHFTHSTSANNEAFEIFIKKGLEIYVDGLQSGDTISFYPLS